MSTAETIFEKARSLPPARQNEVLDFVEFLLAKPDDRTAEDREWAAFSTSQLASAYGPEDAIYDKE